MTHIVPRRLATALVALAAAGLLGACSGTPAAPPSAAPSSQATAAETASTGPSSSTGNASGASTPAGALVLDITLADGKVTPNGDKYDVTIGQTLVLNVTSDHDDEIHVHSEPEVAIEVKAGVPASTQFAAQQSGSFEVEAHHPEKVIAILNVR